MSKDEFIHWTEAAPQEFRYSVALDVYALIEAHCAAKGLSDAEAAKILQISVGTLRSTFGGRRTQSLLKMIKWARALGLKMTVVAYDDGDPDNKRGPISAQVFVECWERAGKPKDFWDLEREDQ